MIERRTLLKAGIDAPRELVFEAHISCEHMVRWWGPRRYTFALCEIDFRPGGAYRIVQRGEDGAEFGFRGEYREIVPPQRIVWTFEYEGMPGHVSLDTLTLQDLGGGRTKLVAHSLFDSKEDRDAMLHSGMEEGAAETWDRLAEYVATMK